MPSLNKEKIRLGVTGSPGTGKKTIGRELASRYGLEFVSLNDYVIERKLGRWIGNEFQVDENKLSRSLDTRGKVICGHFLPYAIPSTKLDFVAILRASPSSLAKRYIQRGYDAAKTRENVLSEVLDIISHRALVVYGREKISEFDTTANPNPKRIASRILATIEGTMPHSYGKINWLENSTPLTLRRLLEPGSTRK